MLKLNNLQSPKGSHKNTKRLGRGQASGQGTQAGKGHKGQKARTGGGVRTGFIGGALPLYMRLPKKGFKNSLFKTEYATVNLGQIAAKFDGEEVSPQTLAEKGLIKGQNRRLPVKVLGDGELNKAMTFVNIKKFSKSAKEAIEKAGGKIQEK